MHNSHLIEQKTPNDQQPYFKSSSLVLILCCSRKFPSKYSTHWKSLTKACWFSCSIHTSGLPSIHLILKFTPLNYSTKMAFSVFFLSVTNLLTPPRHSYKVVTEGQSHKWPSMCTQWAIWLNERHSKANVKYSFKGQMMLWKDCVDCECFVLHWLPKACGVFTWRFKQLNVPPMSFLSCPFWLVF